MPAVVQPILEDDLDEVGHFLHSHLSQQFAADVWSDSLRQHWAEARPNFGMQLMSDDGRRVGVLCALYSDQMIDGNYERFCNLHSWCVLDEYRHASINLVLALIKQRGYHFTMFTPNPKVTKVFMGLRFRLLDDSLAYFSNLSWPWRSANGIFVETRNECIAALLDGVALAEFEAHQSIPWLNFVAFGQPGDACLAIYKRERWKKMPCAVLSHLSAPSVMARHGYLLRRHLLSRGLLVSRIESRFLANVPSLCFRTRRTQPKLVATRSLRDCQVRDIYSELMALDI